MTREIKFRAYWKSKGEIHDVVDIYFGKSGDIQSVRLLADHDGMQYPTDNIAIKDVELMQYTSIKDKNGVKIFEGDVVRSAEATGVIKFAPGSFVIDWGGYSVIGGRVTRSNDISMFDSIEVIGNIHEDKK